GGHPFVVVVGARVAVAAVAEHGDHAAAAAPLQHLADQVEHAPQIRAGGAADPPAEHPAAVAHGRDGGGVGHLDHPVDHLADEGRFHPWPADALDAGGHAGLVAGVAGLVAAVEGGVLRVDHGQTGGVAAVADVAADGGAGAAGARAHDDPFRHRVGLQAHLGVDALGDVVVAAPVGGPFGVGELVHVVPAALGGQPRRLGVHLRRPVDEMAAAALGLDQGDLAR